jgi:hypothetical protein
MLKLSGENLTHDNKQVKKSSRYRGQIFVWCFKLKFYFPFWLSYAMLPDHPLGHCSFVKVWSSKCLFQWISLELQHSNSIFQIGGCYRFRRAVQWYTFCDVPVEIPEPLAPLYITVYAISGSQVCSPAQVQAISKVALVAAIKVMRDCLVIMCKTFLFSCGLISSCCIVGKAWFNNNKKETWLWICCIIGYGLVIQSCARFVQNQFSLSI